MSCEISSKHIDMAFAFYVPQPVAKLTICLESKMYVLRVNSLKISTIIVVQRNSLLEHRLK